MAKRCKKCKVPLEGFMYKWMASKIFKVKPSEKDPELCNKCEDVIEIGRVEEVFAKRVECLF